MLWMNISIALPTKVIHLPSEQIHNETPLPLLSLFDFYILIKIQETMSHKNFPKIVI